MVISCPRSFDKTRSGSQNYVSHWWLYFPLLLDLNLCLDVDVDVETAKFP